MRPDLWQPAVDLSPAEHTIVKRVRRAKLFVFLRHHRHALFSADFQAELAALYHDAPQGQPPIPPAQLALALILQAYTGVSDDEVIEATTMDRRWQLVLDCLDAETAPFSKGTFVSFRSRLLTSTWIGVCWNAPLSWPRPPAPLARASCALPWTALRCGALAGSKIPTIFWATPCARLWA